MHGEVMIEGFDDESIKQASTQYLDSAEESAAMLEQCKQTGVYELLRVPIILLMVCIIYLESTTLPETKTELYNTLRKILIDRTGKKTFPDWANFKELILPSLLSILEELSWKALQKDSHQTLLKKSELKQKELDILKLGLLFEVRSDIATVEEPPTFLSFHHKSMQQFSAAKHITREVEGSEDKKKLLKEFFPTLKVVKKQREVVLFCVGLMSDPKSPLSDPKPLLEHLTALEVEKIQGSDGIEPSADLFIELYKESKGKLPGTPLHNPWVNWYDHREEVDTTPVYIPSKFYWFQEIKQKLTVDDHGDDDNIPECVIHARELSAAGAGSFLQACSEISQRQNITGLYVKRLQFYNALGPEVFNKKAYIKTVHFEDCNLPAYVKMSLLQQLSSCTKLTQLNLRGTSITGMLSAFTPITPLRSLQTIESTGSNASDLRHMADLIRENKLPALRDLNLSGEEIGSVKNKEGELIDVCIAHHQRWLTLNLNFDSFHMIGFVTPKSVQT